jgi:hypothetical protein
MSQVRSIALAYDSREDRLFASVNPGAADTCAFWLTRRVVMDILVRLPPVLAQYSPTVRQVPVEHRQGVAEFEREAAVGSARFTETSNAVLRTTAPEAQLVETLSFEVHVEGVGVVLLGAKGRRVTGVWPRDDVQRLLHLFQREALKAGWTAVAAPGPPASGEAKAKPN